MLTADVYTCFFFLARFQILQDMFSSRVFRAPEGSSSPMSESNIQK